MNAMVIQIRTEIRSKMHEISSTQSETQNRALVTLLSQEVLTFFIYINNIFSTAVLCTYGFVFPSNLVGKFSSTEAVIEAHT